MEQPRKLILEIMGVCRNCRLRNQEITTEVILCEYSQHFDGRSDASQSSLCAARMSAAEAGRMVEKKAGSTRMASETVPHSPTDRALRRLTSEFGRDPVYSSRYGRRRLGGCEVLHSDSELRNNS